MRGVFLFILGSFMVSTILIGQQHIGGQLKQAAMENLAADPPANNIEGQFYWNTNNKELRVFNGTSYEAITSGNPNAVEGPGSSTDNAVTRYDGTTGKVTQNSLMVIDDTGQASGLTDMQINGFNGSFVSDPNFSVGGNTEFQSDEFVIQTSSTTNRYTEIYHENSADGTYVDLFLENGSANGQRTAYLQAGGSPSGTIGITLNVDEDTPINNRVTIEGPDSRLRFDEGGETAFFNSSLINTFDFPLAVGTQGQVLYRSSAAAGETGWINNNQLDLETSAPTCSEGLMFYNDTSDYVCFCDSTATPKQVHSPATNCF